MKPGFLIQGIAAVLLLFLPPPAHGQASVTREVLASGGDETVCDSFQVLQTIGQPAIGVLTDGAYVHQAGFWYVPWFLIVGDGSRGLPEAYRLYQNYPNPFNPLTTVRFALPEPGPVSLRIYDVAGRLVTVVFEKDLDAGFYEIPVSSGRLASGVYFYRLEAAGFKDTKKMVLLR